MSVVHVYSSGLCQCSVCVPEDMPRDQIEAVVNASHPTGLDHGWTIDPAETFKGGEANPCRCNSDYSRMHYLMVC